MRKCGTTKQRYQRVQHYTGFIFKKEDFRISTALKKSYGVKSKCMNKPICEISTGLPRPGLLALCAPCGWTNAEALIY